MAAVSECFTSGSIVWCRTCFNREIEGEVQAFDPQTKMLILKCEPSSGDPKLNNVIFVNLSLVSELIMKKEVPAAPEVVPPLNLQRLNTRIRNNLEEKRKMLQAISTNASTEGQKLFIAIAKTIKEVRWRNAEIVIFNHDVVISPPYQLENIRGNVNTKMYSYIRKVVERHLNESTNSQNTQLLQNNNTSLQ